MLLFSETYDNSTGGHTPDKSTSSPAGFLASHTATPDLDMEMMTTVRSGLKCLELSARLGRAGLLGKTLLASCQWTAGVYSAQYSLIWKMKAIRRKHLLFQLSPSARPTDATGFGLLPTARANDSEKRGDIANDKRNGLPGAIAHLLPTPSSNPPGYSTSTEIVDKDGNLPEHFNQRVYDKKTGRLVQKGLSQIVEAALLPTPKAQNKNAPAQHGQGGMDLQTAISLLPTPAARDYRGANSSEHLNKDRGHHDQLPNAIAMADSGTGTGMKLQPEFVEWMMGFPPGWTELKHYPPRPKKAKRTD